MRSREVWLKTNYRATLLVLLPFASVLAATVLAIPVFDADWVRGTLAACAVTCSFLLVAALYLVARPRLAYERGALLVYLRPGPPLRVPIEVVECFFLGQGPATLPGPIQADSKLAATATIVVRLAEAAEAWKHFDTPPLLGNWCEGYITIRGTWCEPIRPELVKELNAKLVTAQKQLREQRGLQRGADERRSTPAR